MPENRKCFVHGHTYSIGFRTEEGLPFAANPFIILILESILARAQTMYDVVVCHFLVMSNHFHLIIVVTDPAAVPNFVAYLKRESSHAVNKLLGRDRHTVWAEGYDSPTMLDAARVLSRIVYLYLNPTEAGLEDSIDKYPHLNSWNAFLKGGEQIYRRRIARDSIRPLPGRTLSLKKQHEMALELEREAREESVFVIEPDAWMQCFKEYRDRDPEEVKEEIIGLVRDGEEKHRRERRGPVLGAHALRLQPMTKPHQPKKRQPRMICESSIKELRKIHIAWHKERAKEAPKIRHGFAPPEYLNLLPPGFFVPGGVLYSNLLPCCVPTANTVVLCNTE